MEFFDSLIAYCRGLLEDLPVKRYTFNSAEKWDDIGYNQVIMQRDAAFEISGTGVSLVTSSDICEGVSVIGDDLESIHSERKFARISFIQIKEQKDEQTAYNLIRKIEYVKYHFFPEGYMLRSSSRSHKEAVRVSKKAIKNGISFEKVGNLLIEKYKQIPGVEKVSVVFVTEQSFDYSLMQSVAEKNNSITETLNHVMNNVVFDCESCKLKPVCDEVEGMKELHFKTAMGKKG